MPKNICSQCFTEVQRAIAFKQKTERCDTQFKQYLQIIAQKNGAINEGGSWESLIDHVKHEPISTAADPKKLVEPFIIKMELDPLTAEMRFVENDNNYEAAEDHSEIDEKPTEDFVRNSYLECEDVKPKKEPQKDNKKTAKKTPKSSAVSTDGSEESLVCTDCNTRFSRFNALQKHNRNQICILGRLRRDPNTAVNCKNCKAEFTKIGQLNRHINTRVCRTKLKKVREYNCAHCSAVFTRREKISRHFATHGFLPKYPCVYCRKGEYIIERIDKYDGVGWHNEIYNTGVTCFLLVYFEKVN